MDGIDIKIVVNAYDNGQSTGAVRRVMEGRILGPSDVRKNQTTRLRLTNSQDPCLDLLDLRFSAAPTDAYSFCRSRVDDLIKSLQRSGRDVGPFDALLGAVDAYFRQPAATQLEYNDFALANVIYAGLSKANNNSLRAAARTMADVLQITDNVLLNDDRSLFLGAVTRSGRRVTDEADIVCWNNESDPFADIFFVDADGNFDQPVLCFEAWQAIVEADLLILSSGTQWSSLIPTYASRGFRSAIRDSKAEILMVMNRAPDKDNLGQAASDIIHTLVPRYFEAGRLNVLTDKNSHPDMRRLNQSALLKAASFHQVDLSSPGDPLEKHDSTKLAEAIGSVYFRQHLDSRFFLFDYDDTLCGRENSYPTSSSFNVQGIAQLNALTGVAVCSGNSIDALKLDVKPIASSGLDEFLLKPLLVFADGGINEYTYPTQRTSLNRSPYRLVRCVSPESALPSSGPRSAAKIIEALTRAGVPASKIHNRGNAVVAIRPIDREHRGALICLAHSIVYGSDLEVRECGRSTVEIRKPTLSKLPTLKCLCTGGDCPITYVSDEYECSNEREVHRFAAENEGLRCLKVGGPPKTAFFIATLLAHLLNYANR